MKHVILLCASALLAAFGLARVPAQDEVTAVAQGLTAKLQSVLPDRTVDSVEWVTLEDSLGVWAVNLAPTGHLILGTSTKFRALLSWSEDDFVTPEAESPQEALLLELAQRMAEAEAGDGEEDPSWTQSGVAVADLTTIDASAIIYQPVDPTFWHQHGAMKWYVPGTAPCGCGATALSQVMYATRWPVYSEGFYETSLPYAKAGDLTSSERYAFSPYSKIDYSIMDTVVPTDEKTPGNQQIANLVLLAEILSQMTFQPGTSGTIGNFLATNSWTMEPILLEQSGGAFSEAAINKMKAAAANGVPIFCTPPSHIVMGSGYAVVDGVHYVRLNYGWGGTSSGWYPMTDRGEYYIAYPKRTAQCDFLPAVSSATPTLSWHIPLPYDVGRTTKPTSEKLQDVAFREVNGFTVHAIAIPDEVTETTDWTDDFSTRAKDCSGNTGALQLISNELQVKTPGWHEPPKASYTWDPIFIPTEETVWTFSYMYNNARGPVQFQILPLGEGWKTLKTINPGNGATSDGWLEESLDLSAYAGTPCKLRLYVHPTNYRTTGSPNQVTFAMKTMGVSETQVITEAVKTIEIDSATVRNYTFTAADGLAVGTQYAFTVTPSFTDGATGIPSLPCITRIANEAESFATLTFTSPSIEAAENANMRIDQNIFRYCTYAGNSVIRVEANPEANVTDLELYISHPDAFPETAFTVKKHGNGVFDIVIDGSEFPAWPRVNDCLNLTVCALTEAGTRTSHDLSLTFTDSAELAFIETVPPRPAILADFGDTTTDTGWSAANPTGGSSFEMTDAVTGATLTVAATSGTLQSVSVSPSGFTTSGAFRTPLEEDCTSPLAELQKTLRLDEMPGVNTYGAAATQSSDGSDLTLTLSDLTVGQCYTLYAIVGGTTVAPSFNLTAYDTTVKAPVVHAVANEGTAYTDLTTYTAEDILLVRAYNIYPTADGEIVLQTSGINALALAETDYAGILYRAEISTSTATWSGLFGETLPTGKDKVELTVTATDGATLILDSNVGLAELTVSGNPLAVSGANLTVQQTILETDLDVSATESLLGVLNFTDNITLSAKTQDVYTDIMDGGENIKLVYRTDAPVTDPVTFTPEGRHLEVREGAYSNVTLGVNSTITPVTLSGAELTFRDQMAFGPGTITISGGTYTTPKFVSARMLQGTTGTTIEQTGGDITVTGTSEGNDGSAAVLLGYTWGGWWKTISTYNLRGGSLIAEDAGIRLTHNGDSAVNISGGTLKVKGLRTYADGRSPGHPQMWLNLSDSGKLSIGSFNWPSLVNVQPNLSGGELNAFENSLIEQNLPIAGNLTMSADEGARLTIASTLTANNGTRTITKTGPGELDLTGATLSGTFNFIVNAGTLIVDAGEEETLSVTATGGRIGVKLTAAQMISGYTADQAVTFYDSEGVEITDPEMVNENTYVPLNTWTATNGNNWSNTSNWSKGVLPGSENSVIISISADTTINLTEAVSVEHLSVLGSGTLTVSGDFDFDFESFAIAEGVSVALPITDDVTLPIKGSGALIKQGEGTLTLPEDSSLAIQVAAGAISVCDGGTLSGVISGDGKVVVAENQTLTLLGTNTYTGGTVINAGATVKIKTANALGSGAITGSGTLECTGVLPANTAGLTDTANWTGTVKLIEGNYTELQLAPYGAKVEFAGATGYLPQSTSYTGTVTLSGAGWKSLNGWGGDTITLDSIQGDGTLDLTTTAPGNGHCYKITGDTTAFTGSINLGTTKHSVAFGCNTQGTGTIAIGNAVKIANGATWTAPNGVTVIDGGTLAGSGKVAGMLTFEDGATLDMTSGLLTVSGEVVLPASGFITVKVDASVMPEEGESISIVDGMTTAICSAVLTDGTNRYYAMVSSAGETVSVTRIGEFVSGDIEVSVDEHASISEVMNGNYIEPGSESSLVITFTANDQTFIFDNTVDCAFETITVNGSFSGCKLLSAANAARVMATNTTLNTSIDATALNGSLGTVTMNGALTLKVGSADAVSSITSTGGTIEVCADVTYSDSDPLEANTFNGTTFKVGDGVSVTLAARDNSSSATADVYGNIIVGEDATLDLNGRLGYGGPTITLCDGATLTSSARVGSGQNWQSWPTINLHDAETEAKITGEAFASVASSYAYHTWDLKGGTLEIALTEEKTFYAASLNLSAGDKLKVTRGILEFAQKDVADAHAHLILNGGTVNFSKKQTFASLAGSGTISGTFVLVDGMTLDVTQGVATATGATISLPTDGSLTVKVNELPEVGGSVTILKGTVSGTCAGVISVNGNTYNATISQGEGSAVIATRTQTTISDPEITVSDTCTSLSGFLSGDALNAEPGALVLTFTANNQTFTFDNTAAVTFSSITVNAADGVDGSTCSLVSAANAGSVTTTTTAVNTSVNLSDLTVGSLGAVTIAANTTLTMGALADATAFAADSTSAVVITKDSTYDNTRDGAIKNLTIADCTLTSTYSNSGSGIASGRTITIDGESAVLFVNVGDGTGHGNGTDSKIIAKNGGKLRYASRDTLKTAIELTGSTIQIDANAATGNRALDFYNSNDTVADISVFATDGATEADPTKSYIDCLGTDNNRELHLRAGAVEFNVAEHAVLVVDAYFANDAGGGKASKLLKSGVGTMILTGDDASALDDATPVEIAAGTIKLCEGATLGTGAVTVNGGLVYNRTAVSAPTNAFIGSGTITADNCTLDLTEANLDGYTGIFAIVNGGTLILPTGKETAENVTITSGTLALQLSEEEMLFGYESPNASATFYTPTGEPVTTEGTVDGGIFTPPVKTWNNAAADGKWETAGNWANAALPGGSDSVCITLDGDTTLTLASAATIGNLAVRGRGTLTLAGVKLTVTGRMYAETSIVANTTTLSVGSYHIDEGRQVAYGVTAETTLPAVTGAGKFVKTGDATLKLNNAAACEPAIEVAQGCLLFVDACYDGTYRVTAKQGATVQVGTWTGSITSAASTLRLEGGSTLKLVNGNNSQGSGVEAAIVIDSTETNPVVIQGSISGNNTNLTGPISGTGMIDIQGNKNVFVVSGTIADGDDGVLKVKISTAQGVTFSGANTYTGGTTVVSGAKLTAAHAQAIPEASLTGAGTVQIDSINHNPSYALTGEGWTGLVRVGYPLPGGTDYARFGREGSTIEIMTTSSSNYFAQANQVAANLVINGTISQNNGWSTGGGAILSGTITGSGTLQTSNPSGGAPTDVIQLTGDASGFAGTITVNGAHCVAFGEQADDDQHQGQLLVQTGHIANIASGKEWSATNGIFVSGTLGGAGTVSSALTFNSGAMLDASGATPLTASAGVTLPADGTLYVKVTALPTEGNPVTVLMGTATGSCEAILMDENGYSCFATLATPTDGTTIVATFAEGGTAVTEHALTFTTEATEMVWSAYQAITKVNPAAAGTLAITFTADNQTFVFDNGLPLTFTSITVEESAFTGCKVVFSGAAVTTAALTANTSVEVPLALINDANVALTVPTEKTLTVNVATEATLNRAISFDGIFAKKGDATLTLGANVAPVGGTIVAEGTLKFGAGLIPYGSGSYPTTSAGDVTVCGGATLDVNGKPNAFLNMVTLQKGATFANSSTLELSNGSRQLKGLTLEGNATVHANRNFGILAGGHDPATLTLNGHTLTKTGTANFWLSNTAVTEGTLSVEAGAFKSLHQSDDVTTFTTVTLSAGAAEGSSMVLTGKVAATITNEEGDVKVNGTIENGTDLVGSVSVTKGAAILSGANTYTGGTEIAEGATLTITNANALGTGTITGAGTLKCVAVLPANKTGLTNDTWTGTVKLTNIEMTTGTELVLKNYGHANSTVCFNGVTGGYFTPNNGTTFPMNICLEGNGWKSRNGNSDATLIFTGELSGSGTLDMTHGTPSNGQCYKFTGDVSGFSGSINLRTANQRVSFGCESQGAGTIGVASTVNVSGTWTAPNGVKVLADGTLGGTGTVSAALTFEEGATLDTSAGALTANSVTWNGAVVIQVPETVADWATGVCVLKTSATNLPTNYTIKRGETTFSNVTLTAKTVDGVTGIYAVAEGVVLPQISVAEEVIEIATSNVTAIQSAAADANVTEVTSIVGAQTAAGEVDVAGLELFDGVDVTVDAETRTATISYAFGIESITVNAHKKVVVKAKVSKLVSGEGAEPTFAEGVTVELWYNGASIGTAEVSAGASTVTVTSEASILDPTVTGSSITKPMTIKAKK